MLKWIRTSRLPIKNYLPVTPRGVCSDVADGGGRTNPMGIVQFIDYMTSMTTYSDILRVFGGN